MNIPVEDDNLSLVEFFLSNSCSHRYIVEEAKASNSSTMSMMSRRSYNGER